MSSAIKSTGSYSIYNDHSKMTEKFQHLLRPEDRIIQTVRLEGGHIDRNRFLSIVCNEKADEYCLLGIDCCSNAIDQKKHNGDNSTHAEDVEIAASIGLAVKVLWDPEVKLDGDGGFSVRQCGQHYIFKPISVQALWTIIQTLHMLAERLTPQRHSFIEKQYRNNIGAFEEKNLEEPEDWVKEYEKRISSGQSCLNEWHEMPDLLVKRPKSPDCVDSGGFQSSNRKEIAIGSNLRSVMKTVDLDNVTSKAIRKLCESEMEESLEEFKSFIDKEILLILGQMDPASKILGYLYLGSEWNASNLDELRQNNITHILNATREIDNFFPAVFQYKNIRVYDEEVTDLLKFFDTTYKFIREAKEQGGAVLVHCKMGISRSATVVISFMMKEYEMDLAQTLFHVQERRSIVNPNKGFIKQLEVYEGMLGAIRLRITYYGRISHRSKSESSLVQSSNSDQLSNEAESSYNASRLAQEELFTSVNVKAMSLAFSNAFSPVANHESKVPNETADNFPHARPLSEPYIRTERPKSWSPNETLAEFLLSSDIDSENIYGTNKLDFNESRIESITTKIVSESKTKKSFILENHNVIPSTETSDSNSVVECKCFNDLAQNFDIKYSNVIKHNDSLNLIEGTTDHILLCSRSVNDDATNLCNSDSRVQLNNQATTPTKYQTITLSKAPPSPVNSSSNAYNPDCDCNVEVELKVPEEPVKIIDANPDTHTDTIVQNLANVPLQIRSSPLLHKCQVRFNQQETNYSNKHTIIKEQNKTRSHRSFSHPPIINTNASNLMSHYFPTPYFSYNTSNSNAKNNRKKGNKAFNTSVTSSTSSLASLSTSSSSPETPTSFSSQSSGVLRRSSAAGDFSLSSSICHQKRIAKKENRLPPCTKSFSSSAGQSIMSTSLPANSTENSAHNVTTLGIRRGVVEELVTNVFITEKPLVEEEENITNERELHDSCIEERLNNRCNENKNSKLNNSHETCDQVVGNDIYCKQNDELSVKTLANLFDFKIGANTSTVPSCKSYSKLEENKLFIKGKQTGEQLQTKSDTHIAGQANESEC